MKNHNLFLTPDYRYRLPESNFKKLILSLIILLSFVHVAAQNNINISGTVVDDQGEAVIGASVVAQKSKNGTITDVEGNLKLSVDYLFYRIYHPNSSGVRQKQYCCDTERK